MGGFDPAWFIAAAIGVLLLAIDILIPQESRKKIGWILLSLGTLSAIIGFGGLGFDVYVRYWKKTETITVPNRLRVEPQQQPTTKDKVVQPSGHSQAPGRVGWHDKQNWRRFLHTGMTRTEVRQLFGAPEHISVSADAEMWNYGQGEIVFFTDEKPDGSLYSWTEP